MSNFQEVLDQIQEIASKYDISLQAPRNSSRQEIEREYDDLLASVSLGYNLWRMPHTQYVIKPVLDRVRRVNTLTTKRFIEEGLYCLPKLREIAEEVPTLISLDNPHFSSEERLKLAHETISLWLNATIKLFFVYDMAIDANLGNIGATLNVHSDVVRDFVNENDSSRYSNDARNTLVFSGLFVPGRPFDLDHLQEELKNVIIGRSPYKLVRLLEKETSPGLFRDKLRLCLDLVSRNLGDGYNFFTDSVDFLTLWNFYAHQSGIWIRDIMEGRELRRKTTSYLRNVVNECYPGKLRYKPPFVFGALVTLEDSGMMR